MTKAALKKLEKSQHLKGTKFRPDRHIPQLKGTMGKTKPTPNPLVSLLQTAVGGSNRHDNAQEDEEQNFASIIMGEILFGEKGTPPGFGANLEISNPGIAAFTLPSSSHPTVFKSAPYSSSSMDGPIRPKESIEDELLFHPFDEVTVVNPNDFAKEHGIKLDLTDGHGCIIQSSLPAEENATQNPLASNAHQASSTTSATSEGEPTKPIVMRSAYNGVMQLKPEVDDDANLAAAFSAQPSANLSNNPALKTKTVKPISKAEFAEQCDRLGLRESAGVVASVSGGPDSMAMALLLAEYCVTINLPLLCVTVDHAMRPEAPAEALVTQTWLHALGIPHTIVRVEWPNGTIPTQGIQSKARDARYEAVTKIALELQKRLSYFVKAYTPSPATTTINTTGDVNATTTANNEAPATTTASRVNATTTTSNDAANATSNVVENEEHEKKPPKPDRVTPQVHVLMAHNADDNIETFWLRMAGCSGLYGLAGIAEKRVIADGAYLTRPVLAFSKLRLYATLIAANQPWASDPSNAKLLYKRNQVRHTLDSLYSTSNSSTSISPPSTIAHPHAKPSTAASVDPLEGARLSTTLSNPLSTATSVATAPYNTFVPNDGCSVSLEDMARLQHNFTKSRFLLDSITHRFCSDYISISKKYGYIVIPTQPLLHLPEIFAFRVMDTVLAHVSGDSSPMRLKSIKSCLTKIRTAAEVMDSVPITNPEADLPPPDIDEISHKSQARGSRNGSNASSAATNRLAAETSNLSTSFCVHRCIVIQTPRRLMIVPQNMPNAPAALVKGKTPLPPYRADTALPFGRDGTIHWMNSWRISYKPTNQGEVLFGRRPGALPSPLPQNLYVRQLQSFDLPILRKLGHSFNTWSNRLSRHVLLALPIIVDENSHIVEFPFLSSDGRTIASLPDGEGLASLSMRASIEKFARIRATYDPAYHLTERPKSTFVGYSRISKQDIPDPLAL